MSTSPASRHDVIVAAATEVFLQYGYQKSTMGDIATAAGLTRPTLYLSFPDKKSIFFTVIGALVDAKLEQIRDGLEGRTELVDRLEFACRTWALGAQELMATHPNAADLFDRAFLPVRESYASFETLLATILPGPGPAHPLRYDERELATLISRSVWGLTDMARDAEDLTTSIRALCHITAAALER